MGMFAPGPAAALGAAALRGETGAAMGPREGSWALPAPSRDVSGGQQAKSIARYNISCLEKRKLFPVVFRGSH